MKAKLIFNPASGNPTDSAAQLVELLRDLQNQNIESEVLIVEPAMQLRSIARRAAQIGYKMVVVSGGDGTIENVALGLVGSRTTLGIIPTGTRNNLARSLGIPLNNIADAVALLRNGRRLKIDMGLMRHGQVSSGFFEAGVIGLGSALYSSADDLQHGDLGKIAEFISTLVAAAPSEFRLRLDHQSKDIVTNAHMVIIANVPFIGPSYQIASDVVFDDRRLDVFVYSDLNKRELLGQAIQSPASTPDARIQRFRARAISIKTNPAMPAMADGNCIGDGSVIVTLHPHRLRVMAGSVLSTVGAKSKA